MDKKKILYVVGILAVAGGIYYYYKSKNGSTKDFKSKRNALESPIKKDVENIKSASSLSTDIQSTLSKKDNRKEDRADSKKYALDCGKKPLFKKNRVEWQKCVDRMKSGAYGFDGYISHSNFAEMGELFNEFDI
jgi:hypothetical protein